MSSGPPPRILVAVAGIVLIASGVLAVLGALATGVTTDEPVHVMRLNNYFDNGWYALDWDYRGAGPGSETTNTFVYAPVATLLLHAWSVLWGTDSWGHVSGSAHAYDVRHLGVVLIGYVGLLAVAAIGRVLFRHWRWGLVAAAVLAAIPMWVGNTMVNIKDVPVATGHTLVTLALLLFVRREPPSPVLRLGRAALLIAGLMLTLGTRPGMWSGMSVMIALAAAGIVLAGGQRLRTSVELAAACVATAGALALVYPNVFGSPLRMVERSTAGSSDFFDGAPPDRLYAPRHLLEEMPSLLLALMVLGTVVAVLVLVRGWRGDPVPAFRVALIGAQAFTLPLVAIALGSDLYQGLRQLLFAIPALAVLATYGVVWCARRGAVRGRRLVTVVAAAALVLPMVDQVTLQPYQTSYLNLATDLLHSSAATEDRYGTDAWRTSLAELVEGQDLRRPLLCKTAIKVRDSISLTFFPYRNRSVEFSPRRNVDCREESTGPLRSERLPIRNDPTDHTFDAVFVDDVPANCSTTRQVTRWRHGVRVVLSSLGRCRLDPPVLTTAPVLASSEAFATGRSQDIWRFALHGWSQQPGDRVLTAPFREARIAFATNDGCRRDGCTVLLVGAAPEDLVVTLDGRTVPVSVSAVGVGVPVTTEDAATGDLWLTLSRPSGEELDVRLTGLRLEPLS